MPVTDTCRAIWRNLPPISRPGPCNASTGQPLRDWHWCLNNNPTTKRQFGFQAALADEMRLSVIALAGIAGCARAHRDHGSGSQKPVVGENATWMAKHMAGMAHINDPRSHRLHHSS